MPVPFPFPFPSMEGKQTRGETRQRVSSEKVRERLAESLLFLRRPALAGGCRTDLKTREADAPNTTPFSADALLTGSGLGSLPALRQRIVTGHAIPPAAMFRTENALRSGLTEWREMFRGMAGRQKTPFAVRLHRAADSLSTIHDQIVPLREEESAGKTEILFRLEQAQTQAEAAAQHLTEALLLHMETPLALREILLASPQTRLSQTELPEIIYLARAGTPLLKMLAARRLAGCAHASAISTLEQLLYDRHPAVAENAFQSLQEIAGKQPDRFCRLYAETLRNVLEEADAGTLPASRWLPFALLTAQEFPLKEPLHSLFDAIRSQTPNEETERTEAASETTAAQKAGRLLREEAARWAALLTS